MTAAQVRDVLSRLPRCAGQAGDAVSAYTQVKMERSKIAENCRHRNAPPSGFVYLGSRWPKLWDKIQEHVVASGRTLYKGSESSRMGMFMFEPAARTISIRVYGRYQNRREEKQLWNPDGKRDETNRSRGTNCWIIPAEIDDANCFF